MNARAASPIRARSRVALAAHLRGGAGKHADRRTRRLRTRQATNRAALRDT